MVWKTDARQSERADYRNPASVVITTSDGLSHSADLRPVLSRPGGCHPTLRFGNVDAVCQHADAANVSLRLRPVSLKHGESLVTRLPDRTDAASGTVIACVQTNAA
jgi:hypothetical protein